MSFGLLLAIIGGIVLISGLALFIILKPESSPKKRTSKQDLVEKAESDVERVFNDEFREELRNRGRLHFEKIISENAMFLQQDLRLTTSQLNEFMKTEITSVLQCSIQRFFDVLNKRGLRFR